MAEELTVGLGVLTYNQIATGRADDFWQTIETTSEEFCGYPRNRLVLTNGSTDGTDEVVREVGGVVDNADSSVWYGNTRLIQELRGNDLIVLSADDLAYREGWLRDLVAFFIASPFPLASAYLEPLWDWNAIKRVVTYAGQRALVRESVCGSSWIFRPADWFSWMGPFPEHSPGEDLPICARVREHGDEMAALNLCNHVGQERSAWGNRSHEYARPVDPREWGLDD